MDNTKNINTTRIKWKRRLLTVAKIIWEETDAKNPISTREIIECLETKGIHAERKVIYRDIEAIREFFPIYLKSNKGFYRGDTHEKD